MRGLAFCICEDKDAVQLRDNREADLRLCFRYLISTIPFLPKYKFLSLYLSPVTAQPGVLVNLGVSDLVGIHIGGFLTPGLILF